MSCTPNEFFIANVNRVCDSRPDLVEIFKLAGIVHGPQLLAKYPLLNASVACPGEVLRLTRMILDSWVSVPPPSVDDVSTWVCDLAGVCFEYLSEHRKFIAMPVSRHVPASLAKEETSTRRNERLKDGFVSLKATQQVEVPLAHRVNAKAFCNMVDEIRSSSYFSEIPLLTKVTSQQKYVLNDKTDIGSTGLTLTTGGQDHELAPDEHKYSKFFTNAHMICYLIAAACNASELDPRKWPGVGRIPRLSSTIDSSDSYCVLFLYNDIVKIYHRFVDCGNHNRVNRLPEIFDGIMVQMVRMLEMGEHGGKICEKLCVDHHTLWMVVEVPRGPAQNNNTTPRKENNQNHTNVSKKSEKTSLCTNFLQRGQCRFGDKCRFSHARAPDGFSLVPRSQNGRDNYSSPRDHYQNNNSYGNHNSNSQNNSSSRQGNNHSNNNRASFQN